MRPIPSRSGPRGVALGAAALFLALAAPLRAQMPGAPVLQNAFTNPGVTVGANFAGGKNTSTVAAAAAWAPTSGRFQLSLGVGSFTRKDSSGILSYGARMAVPVLSLAGGKIGVAPFLGIGGGKKDSTGIFDWTAGAGAGMRFAVGATRAGSVYATGTWLSEKDTFGDTTQTDGRVRFAVAGDLTLFRNVGLTVGYEGGSAARQGEAGPRGSILGVGLSYAFR